MARFVFTNVNGKYMESTREEDRIEDENAGSGYLAFWTRVKTALMVAHDMSDGLITDLDTGEEFKI